MNTTTGDGDAPTGHASQVTGAAPSGQTEDPLGGLTPAGRATHPAGGSAATFTIYHGEELLLAGDELSIGMVFNNMTGTNFEGRAAEHRDYLARVGAMLDLTIAPSLLRLRPAGGGGGGKN